MTGKKKNSPAAWHDPDDAPDLSTPAWQEKFAQVQVSRGRPRLPETKRATTIRLDADIIRKFKAKGPKWQTRINDALREWLDKAG
jgi:uncharacterized protein (DUF4415 family)